MDKKIRDNNNKKKHKITNGIKNNSIYFFKKLNENNNNQNNKETINLIIPVLSNVSDPSNIGLSIRVTINFGGFLLFHLFESNKFFQKFYNNEYIHKIIQQCSDNIYPSKIELLLFQNEKEIENMEKLFNNIIQNKQNNCPFKHHKLLYLFVCHCELFLKFIDKIKLPIIIIETNSNQIQNIQEITKFTFLKFICFSIIGSGKKKIIIINKYYYFYII